MNVKVIGAGRYKKVCRTKWTGVLQAPKGWGLVRGSASPKYFKLVLQWCILTHFRVRHHMLSALYAIAGPSVRPSVCLAVGLVSPYGSPIHLVFAG